VKVGIFDPYLDDLGGGEKYMMKITQCLAGNNHDIDIFWDNKKDLDELKDRFLLDLSGIKLEKNIFSTQTSLFERLKQSRKYDIIIVLSDGSIPLLLCGKIFLHLQQPLSFQKIGLTERLKLLKIKRIFCNSYYTKSFIDKTLKVKSDVLYPPIELKPKKVNKENIILHVGRFRVKNNKNGDYKKQSVMIDSFKDMIRKGLKDWRFVLAVSVKEKDTIGFNKLKKNAQGFPVEFIVNKNNDQLWDIYSKAKIYWHASGFGEDLGKHPEYAEHFGISTVEAMGAGVVPVVIDAGGQKEIVQDGKSGFLWNSLPDLKEKTILLINDNKLLTMMSEEAKKRAEVFSGDRFCKELYQILDL